MLEIWLIRHGETAWNAEDRILALRDMPLNDRGRTQAEHLRQRFERDHTSFDAVYASDLSRARTTAELALPGHALRTDPRLRELDYGAFEGHRWSDMGGALADQARRWRAEPYGRRAPDGESYDDVIARFAAFAASLPRSGRIAAFSHGGTIRCVLYGLMGRPARGAWGLDSANTGITRLRYGERRVTVVSLNDHAHLRDQ